MSNEKRLQQIRDAARYKYPDERIHFIDGAKWADSHPQWIPVKKEQPKVSGDYIICEKRGFVKEAHYFELDDLWMLPGGALVSPTHWMPLPEAPRKEADND